MPDDFKDTCLGTSKMKIVRVLVGHLYLLCQFLTIRTRQRLFDRRPIESERQSWKTDEERPPIGLNTSENRSATTFGPRSLGKKLGQDELANLAEVIASGTLTSTKGKFVKKLEEEFADKLGVRHVYACASGTAAVHTAIAAH